MAASTSFHPQHGGGEGDGGAGDGAHHETNTGPGPPRTWYQQQHAPPGGSPFAPAPAAATAAAAAAAVASPTQVVNPSQSCRTQGDHSIQWGSRISQQVDTEK